MTAARVGDYETARALTSVLKTYNSKYSYDEYDDYSTDVLEALTTLNASSALPVVETTILKYTGFDSRFIKNPHLVGIKNKLQLKIKNDVIALLKKNGITNIENREVSALVLLENISELIKSPKIVPKFSVYLWLNIPYSSKAFDKQVKPRIHDMIQNKHGKNIRRLFIQKMKEDFSSSSSFKVDACMKYIQIVVSDKYNELSKLLSTNDYYYPTDHSEEIVYKYFTIRSSLVNEPLFDTLLKKTAGSFSKNQVLAESYLSDQHLVFEVAMGYDKALSILQKYIDDNKLELQIIEGNISGGQ